MSETSCYEKTLKSFNVGDTIYFFQFIMGQSIEGRVKAATSRYLIVEFPMFVPSEHLLDRDSYFGRSEKELFQEWSKRLKSEVVKLEDEKQKKEERIEAIEKALEE